MTSANFKGPIPVTKDHGSFSAMSSRGGHFASEAIRKPVSYPERELGESLLNKRTNRQLGFARNLFHGDPNRDDISGLAAGETSLNINEGSLRFLGGALQRFFKSCLGLPPFLGNAAAWKCRHANLRKSSPRRWLRISITGTLMLKLLTLVASLATGLHPENDFNNKEI